MKKAFIPLIEKDKLCDGFKQVFSSQNIELLLIQFNSKIFLLENKCGHFGVSLEDAEVEFEQNKNIIICQQHGISFDLVTGKVVNRPWENCNPINILEPIINNKMVGFLYP